MKLKYNTDDRLPAGQLVAYSIQWFVLAVAVVATSVFVAQGSPADELFYAQKLFAVMGFTGLIQILWGHRLPIVVGPAAVLLVGVMTSLNGGHSTEDIYTSIAVGGVIVSLLSLGNTMRYVQRLFTPRIIVVILMLIAFTLAPTISNTLVFDAKMPEAYTFSLIFAAVGTMAMVILNRKLTGVAKSLIIPGALAVGSLCYYAFFPMREYTTTAASWEGLLISEPSFNGGLIIAFVVCYIALIINDIGSIESVGALLKVPNMDRRLKRGVGISGVMNIVAGSMGVLGPVNYSMSPGVIASTGCASRYALIPSTVALMVCALCPDLIWVLTAIPLPVIGVILLFLMGTQLAASFEMMHSTKSAETFSDALTLGLPIMVAMLFQLMPKDVAPEIIQPLVGNGFAMGVITVILMEHVVNRKRG